VLPASASARQVDDTLRADFAPSRDTPITLAVDGGAQQAARIAGLAAQSPAVTVVGRPIRLAEDSYALNLVPPLRRRARAASNTSTSSVRVPATRA